MLQLLILAGAAFRGFSNTGFPALSGRWVIAFSAPCFLPLNTGAPRGPTTPTPIHPSCKVRERLFRKQQRGRFQSLVLSFLLWQLLGEGAVRALAAFTSFRSSTRTRMSLHTDKVCPGKAALTNFLQ